MLTNCCQILYQKKKVGQVFSESEYFTGDTCTSIDIHSPLFASKAMPIFHLMKIIQSYSCKMQWEWLGIWLIELGFNDTSTLVGHFVSSPREREKIDRRDSRRDEREGQGRKRNRNESEETEEIKTSPPYPYLLQG